MTDELLDLKDELEKIVENESGDGISFKAARRGRPKGSTTNKGAQTEREDSKAEFTESVKKEDISATLVMIDVWASEKMKVSTADPELLDRIADNIVVVAKKYEAETHFQYMPEIILAVLLLMVIFSKWTEYQIMKLPETEAVIEAPKNTTD